MITDNYLKVLPDMSMRPMLGNQDLGKLISEQRIHQEAASEREKELSIYRSGSAPPTVEGSLNSIGGLFDGTEFQAPLNKGAFLSEEEIRSDPAYVNYYYANVNLNPRLSPPLVSKEEIRFAQRLQGSIGDRRKATVEGNRSLFAVQPGFGGAKEELGNGGVEWGGDGLIGLSGLDLGSRKKSIAEVLQDDMGPVHPISRHPSRPTSRNAFNDGENNSESVPRATNIGATSCHSYASALGASLSRSTTPDPQLAARAPSPRIPPIGGGKANSMDKRDAGGSNSFKGLSPALNGSADIAAALSGLNLSSSNYGFNGYPMSPSSPSLIRTGNLPPLFENAAMGRSGLDSRTLGDLGPNLMAELQNLNRVANQNTGNALQNPLMDPSYLQYLRSNEYATLDREYLGNSYMDLLQKAYLGSLLSPQKSHYGVHYPGKTGGPNQNYYGNPSFGLGMPYSGGPIRHGERNLRFSPGIRNLSSAVMDESFPSSLLDEFKSNKTRCFELSEIAGHVVEFSADQYGSRFIQQKLETATTDEKNMVFNEIMPQALSLMTDVFGNYVIQKFFEHGSAAQIRELADQLSGHVLTLSLQMYGCRVIQKAIEMVELDQKTKMVMELDGQIMRCVRDQNGNHVIQKCIECVPEDAIQFIVTTFYDQVVALSTHPYGCRVIQRVLEHCHDAKTQRIMMDEILLHVLMLAQDQYGNYVVQHVLEHGNPNERSQIIMKLMGQIVQMSQQKFASNVIEKCLTFGTLAERQALVDEMLGTTDENEPLQVVMKDQFGNYVVQRVLETCDDQQLELILNRIKVHLNALKKYTYGKHIVARVEKLVAAGERRISILTLQSPAQTTA